jgi:peptide deformylase
VVVRKILLNGNPLLRKISKPIKAITPDIRKLVDDMVETMHENRGAGLAAVQIGDLRRLVVIDVSENKDQLLVLINPKIIKKSNDEIGKEACLSVPGLEGRVCRAQNITVKAKNLQFKDVEFEAEGYFAVAVQHELDHLDGILYIDRVETGTLKTSRDDDDE